MTVDEPLRITLELDPGSDPIRGRLCDERGSERTFAGWLGLMGAVEAALPEEAGSASAPPEQATPAASDPTEREP